MYLEVLRCIWVPICDLSRYFFHFISPATFWRMSKSVVFLLRSFRTDVVYFYYSRDHRYLFSIRKPANSFLSSLLVHDKGHPLSAPHSNLVL